MARYKRNSDSFNQLLLKLDEHGARANFVDELLRYSAVGGTDRLKYVRTCSYKRPYELLRGAFLWSSTTDGLTYWSRIYDKIGGW